MLRDGEKYKRNVQSGYSYDYVFCAPNGSAFNRYGNNTKSLAFIHPQEIYLSEILEKLTAETWNPLHTEQYYFDS